jgi:hypothetical protein
LFEWSNFKLFDFLVSTSNSKAPSANYEIISKLGSENYNITFPVFFIFLIFILTVIKFLLSNAIFYIYKTFEKKKVIA